MKRICLIGLGAALLLSTPMHANNIDGINGGLPNRISMNVTVPKQTQGATFGEKVNAGLHAAGSVVAQGASLSIVVDCGQAACMVTLPDGSGYRADLQRQRVEVLKSNTAGDPDATAPRAIGQGASLLGGALPGGSIVSAAVSSVGNLAGGGAAAASYAATGRVIKDGNEGLATANATPGVIDVLDPLVEGDYLMTLVVDKANSGLKDTLKTQVRTAAPQRVEIRLAFTVQGGILKARHNIALNAVRNMK